MQILKPRLNFSAVTSLILGALPAMPEGTLAQRVSLTDLDQRLTTIEQKPTPEQIATKRWYAGRTGVFVPLAGGGHPFVLEFDGDQVWVANNHNANVTKVRANDGANFGAFGVGLNPAGLAYDGVSI